MTFKRRDYLLIVDYFSKFVETPILLDKTAQSVILALKPVFARHGIPEELVADNMPFGSQAFQMFAHEWGFKVTTTSPRYPQANGLAERNIQTIKQLLRKADHEGRDPYLALLDHRSSPITGLDASPAELLMGRPLRTKLPPPPVPQQAEERDQLYRRQLQQKKYYDRHAAAEAAELKPGDVVRIQRGKEWEPAIVTAKSGTPRSYVVNQGGTTLRRNRRSLHPTKEPPPKLSTLDADINADSPQSLPMENDRSDRCPQEAYPTDKDNSKGTTHTPTYTTASGRSVRPPRRFDDYVVGDK